MRRKELGIGVAYAYASNLKGHTDGDFGNGGGGSIPSRRQPKLLRNFSCFKVVAAGVASRRLHYFSKNSEDFRAILRTAGDLTNARKRLALHGL